jgi:AraC-like DNA-binding protein
VVRYDPNERLAFFRSVSLPGTEVMAVYESTKPWHMFHERYAFCVCKRAAAGVRYRGKDHIITGGVVLVREPGETHYNTFIAQPAEFKTLFIEPAVFSAAATELAGTRSLHFPPGPITGDACLYGVLDLLCASIEGAGETLAQQSLFATAVAAIARHAERETPAAELRNSKLAVHRAKAHLRERFNEPVSLKELAAVARVSRFHLVHAFARETGLGPHAYQIHIRVERARRLLQGGMSAASAAASVGFADQSHFTRCFKRIMHVTPGEYAGAAGISVGRKLLPPALLQMRRAKTLQAQLPYDSDVW